MNSTEKRMKELSKAIAALGGNFSAKPKEKKPRTASEMLAHLSQFKGEPKVITKEKKVFYGKPGEKGDIGDRGFPGRDGRDARVFINEMPKNPQKGDIWIQD